MGIEKGRRLRARLLAHVAPLCEDARSPNELTGTALTYTSVEVCAGAGGQALGLEAAGFDHLACVEIDPAACQTLRHNRKQWNVIEADLTKWVPDEALKAKQIDLLAGGVPCPPFSIAGRQLGRDDERDLFPVMRNLAEELKPRAVMIENVRGILGKKFDSYRQEIIDGLSNIEGHRLKFCGWQLLDAQHYGVPQSRPRAILIMMEPEAAKRFEWPDPEDFPRKTVGQALRRYMAADAWEGAAEWAKNAQGIAPTLVGGSKKHGGADLGPTRARAAWRVLGVDGAGLDNKPPQPGRDKLPRLTVEMAAVIQGFPTSWVFQGRKTAAYRQVGNAFPPPVAEAVGRRVFEALEAADNTSGRATAVG
jgi:DNA (cytosine-5)-methyltransferase 1